MQGTVVSGQSGSAQHDRGPGAGWLYAAVDRAAAVTSVLGMAIIGVMVLHISVDVTVRLFAGHALPGTIAFVSNYYMIGATFLPLMLTERERKHIEVEVLTRTLPEGAQAALRVLAWAATAALFFVLAYQSWGHAMHAFRRGMFIVEQGYRIEIWISYFLLPIGYALTGAVAFLRIGVAAAGLGRGAARAVARAESYFDPRSPASSGPAEESAGR